MSTSVGEALRVLDGFEAVYVEARSPAIIRIAVAGAELTLREALGGGADVNELACALAVARMAVLARSLFDTSDARLQPLSARYREYLRADICLR